MLNSTQTWIASSTASSVTPAARSGFTSAGPTSVGASVSFSRKPSVARSFGSSGAVRTGSEETLVQAGGERGKQLPLAHAPRRGPAHHRLRPVAHRAAEEFRPVEQRLYDVGNPTHAHHADEHELQALRQSVAVLDGGEAHQRCSCVPPLRAAERGTGGEDDARSALSPRWSRPTAAPSAADTVTSKRRSSELPARLSAT